VRRQWRRGFWGSGAGRHAGAKTEVREDQQDGECVPGRGDQAARRMRRHWDLRLRRGDGGWVVVHAFSEQKVHEDMGRYAGAQGKIAAKRVCNGHSAQRGAPSPCTRDSECRISVRFRVPARRAIEQRSFAATLLRMRDVFASAVSVDAWSRTVGWWALGTESKPLAACRARPALAGRERKSVTFLCSSGGWPKGLSCECFVETSRSAGGLARPNRGSTARCWW